MKYILSILMGFILYACVNEQKQQSAESISETPNNDMLIGNFSGHCIDTLLCEPMDSLNTDYRGLHYKWRVYAKNGTVKDLIITNQTIGIHFVKEGDLDGNGTDEWGYVTELETSNWMSYHAFTNINGEWKHIIEPTAIWIPHIDPQDSLYYTIRKEDILQTSENAGFLKVKFSDVRNDGEDFLLVDTLIRITPQTIEGFDCIESNVVEK